MTDKTTRPNIRPTKPANPSIFTINILGVRLLFSAQN
jgi:hypothetical protein